MNKTHAQRGAKSSLDQVVAAPPPYIYKGGSGVPPSWSTSVVTNDRENVPQDVDKVIIDPSVTTIGDHAFNGCTCLASIEIPQSVTTIGDHAFRGCKSLASIVIPQSVTTIGDYAFQGCISLASIEIPQDVTTIGDHAFYGCTSLASIVISQGVTTIGEYAFYGCTSLASIVIPQSVTTIEQSAFNGCTSLASIEIPQGVTTIGGGAFRGCISLALIEILQGVTTIGGGAFNGCTSLASIVIPQSATTIEQSAFNGCTSLASIVIPQGVTRIGGGAFYVCTSLASIEIPQGVTTIGDCAFYGCTSLASIVIPQTVTKIGYDTFQGCLVLAKGAAAGANTEDVEVWLKSRFDGLPVHTVCYRSDVTREKIIKCLEMNSDSVKAVDSLDLSALHVLLMNEKVTLEMVDVLLKAHPDAAKDVGPLGMYPLHLACNNPHAPLKLLKLLSSYYTKDGRAVLTVADENNHLPVALAIRHNRPDDIILHFFERYPIKASNLREKFDSICDQYIKNLESEDYIKSFDTLQQHGWVSFANGIEIGSDSAKGRAQLIQLIEEGPAKIVRFLAYCKDLQGRLAIESATKDIRTALEKRLLFLGRFELAKGPPLHKSSTSLVIKVIDRRAEDEYRKAFEMALEEEEPLNEHGKCIGEKGCKVLLNSQGIGGNEEAFKDQFVKWDLDHDGKISEEECLELFKSVLDNGRPREVVLKFMRNAGQFKREVDFRDDCKFDSKYVAGVTDSFSCNTHDNFASALKSFCEYGGLDLRAYKHAIVMPFADRNLDAIFRSERPDEYQIRVLAKQLAEAIKHVHSKGIIHGDVKLQNVVRFGEGLRLIDLDAAVEIDSFAGAKFSSGVLPPEMITKLTIDDCEHFANCFKEVKNADADWWAKIDPKESGDAEFFVVKTFLTNAVEYSKKVRERGGNFVMKQCIKHCPVNESELPYSLVKATKAIDIWSFGVILYALDTGAPLFDVDRDDDLKATEAMKELFEWNDYKKAEKLQAVKDPLVGKLLMKILSEDPSKRFQSMEEILADDYFVSANLVEHNNNRNLV